MKCPICNVNLVMSERQGVEIDYCPECRGVWLDRGELDKIIEGSTSANKVERQESPSYSNSQGRNDYHENRDHDDEAKYSKSGYPQKKKRESWIGDLFDF